MRSAKDHGLIFGDVPTEKVGTILTEKQNVEFWTKEEFEKVIACLNKDSYTEHFVFTFLWLYYFTGMRVNEATALYWEDVDFERKALSIRYNLQYVNRNNWERSDKLKTDSSKRIIGLDDNTLSVLKDWQMRQAELSEIDFIISLDLSLIHI